MHRVRKSILIIINRSKLKKFKGNLEKNLYNVQNVHNLYELAGKMGVQFRNFIEFFSLASN